MKYAALAIKLIAWLSQFIDWLNRQEAVLKERERIDAENKARLARQNEVAKKPVTNDELKKSLEDGTF